MAIPLRNEVLKPDLLRPGALSDDVTDECRRDVEALMKEDRSLDALERCPLGELPIGNTELEFVGGNAQGERYSEELPSAWAGPKTAASCLSSASETPHSRRATS
jgi:hypothetical protein